MGHSIEYIAKVPESRVYEWVATLEGFSLSMEEPQHGWEAQMNANRMTQALRALASHNRVVSTCFKGTAALFVALLALCGLAGCANTNPSAFSTRETRTQPDRPKLIVDNERGFQIQYPQWWLVDSEPREASEAVSAFSGRALENKGLVAVGVYVFNVKPGTQPKDLADYLLAAPKSSARHMVVLERLECKARQMDSYRVAYLMDDTLGRVQVTSYFFVAGTNGYMVKLGALQKDFAKYESELDDILGSFKLITAVGEKKKVIASKALGFEIRLPDVWKTVESPDQNGETVTAVSPYIFGSQRSAALVLRAFDASRLLQTPQEGGLGKFVDSVIEKQRTGLKNYRLVEKVELTLNDADAYRITYINDDNTGAHLLSVSYVLMGPTCIYSLTTTALDRDYDLYVNQITPIVASFKVTGARAMTGSLLAH